MFSNIKTTKANKELVSFLTNKLNLGTENIIARLAFAHSIAKERHLDVTKTTDSGGKEYSAKVLFGDYIDFYIAIVCVHYNIYKSDKDVPKLIKMHIDDGLELISEELKENSNLVGTDFLINKIEAGLTYHHAV